MDLHSEIRETSTQLEMIAEQICIHKMILENVIDGWRQERGAATLYS